MRRSQRIAVITKLLVENPYKIYSLTDFAKNAWERLNQP